MVKGNSVFSNSHKYSKPMENLTPITTSLQISKERSTKSNRAQEASEGSAAPNQNIRGSATMKLNAHQIKPPNGSFRQSQKSEARDSIQTVGSSFSGATKGPTIGAK